MNSIRPCVKLSALLILVIAIGIGAVLSAGCLSQADDRPEGDVTVKIGDILEEPTPYNATTVTVRGRVVNQCGSGCWFFLDDGTGTIYVDLLPNNFSIPPMIGSRVTVKGTIQVDGKDVTLVGRSVITDLRAYP